jgi:TPR repeat protein
MTLRFKTLTTLVLTCLVLTVAVAGFLIPSITGSGGNALTRRIDETRIWNLRALAIDGDIRKQAELGAYYMSEDNFNFDQAIYWLEMSANGGSREAKEYLALIYLKFASSREDVSNFVFWLIKAAEQAAETGIPLDWGFSIPSYAYANQAFYEGKYEQAAILYAYAAGVEQPWGMNGLGVCFESGAGVAQNSEKALYWYKKAAERGQPQAQYNLGRAYFNGEIAGQNLALAFMYFKKSAEQGYAGAFDMLEACYSQGYGADPDLFLAKYWRGQAENLSAGP